MSFALDRFLPYRLSVAAAQVSRRFAARYAAEAGLSIPEWRVLAHLAHSGAVSVRDINARVHLDKSVVSRAAARLQEAGWVRKSGNAADRRLVVLELTPEGRALMARLGRIAEAFQAELLAELGPEAEALDRALARLAGTEAGAP
ncbi:DNA-binding MarR family transcriptional regulator [Paracoccus pantotrophus]|uniref:DNA-binding MarR family transcriptional regulator n=1 Tax=Paracoccus pantotrophus TaxID=82367 RepID=A0AAE6NX90_PARPN|nr:MarR family winged helix-turn-helix transcriptional regulator [Paracoccus pantotrophus]QFG36528.1 winged helix-turn-helix transcriptional regulator [Paracoccus pantotrophus]RDD92410.1 MarR family transcriptional regulator [Paracoccus pantotrophus]RKS42880.1 DNA-binding MarR family transcriptional regulator [Paracoccus pantotrophus]WGR65988.1 MarR family transcriptional regulator [Paracoccus pantotrophus]